MWWEVSPCAGAILRRDKDPGLVRIGIFQWLEVPKLVILQIPPNHPNLEHFSIDTYGKMGTPILGTQMAARSLVNYDELCRHLARYIDGD